MRPRDRAVAARLADGLQGYDQDVRALPGIAEGHAQDVFVQQLIDSIHRVRYPAVISERDISPRRADPDDELFDPIKAAALHHHAGNIDEAFWCVFLFVHFGRHLKGGYRYAREVYGRLGDGRRWDWTSTSADPRAFRRWLAEHQEYILRKEVPGGFGSHRRRQSLRDEHRSGTGAVVESYVRWVAPPRSHQDMVNEALDGAEGDPRVTFDALYQSMDAVTGFGRLARLDYLAMLGKLDLATIEPGSAYLQGATGPLQGARLLFGQHGSNGAGSSVMDQWLQELGDQLGVGMQVMEDALCNWQKSPGRYAPFRG